MTCRTVFRMMKDDPNNKIKTRDGTVLNIDQYNKDLDADNIIDEVPSFDSISQISSSNKEGEYKAPQKANSISDIYEDGDEDEGTLLLTYF